MASRVTAIRATARITRRIFNKAWILIVMLLAVHFGAGLLYSMFEGISYADGQWWATVTGSTVGYGDFYPKTEAGRFVATWYMVIMAFLQAFIIGHIINAVIEDKNLFTNDEQESQQAVLLLMAQKMGVLPADMRELPPLAYFKERGLKVDEAETEDSV